MMHWQTLAFIYAALSAFTFLLVNDLLSGLEPTLSAIGRFAASPQWRVLACAIGMVISTFAFERTKQSFSAIIVQFPRFALKLRTTVMTYQPNRLYPSWVPTLLISPLSERALIWLSFPLPKPELPLFPCFVELLFASFGMQTWACLYAVNHFGANSRSAPKEFVSAGTAAKHMPFNLTWGFCHQHSTIFTRLCDAFNTIVRATTQ
jgi:hypothetical protein